MFSACTRVEMADQPPAVSIDGGFAGQSEGGAGSVPGAGGTDSGGVGVDSGGSPESVVLGIWPTYATDAADGQVGAVLASVSALSAGSLTLPMYERWDDLSSSTGSPRAVTWARLDAMIEPYRERAADVALCVGIVDRASAAWPVAALDEQAAIDAIRSTIDQIYTRYAPRLTHLCFGHEVDRYLQSADADQSEQVLALLSEAVRYARRHPLKSARTAVGTSITLTALAGESRAQLEQLLIGDEAVVVYDALDAEGELKEPDAIASELRAALDSLENLADRPMPLALFEMGYPSAGATGATERAQRSYYEALFSELDSHRSRVSFVGVYGLEDRSASDCEAEAAAFGDDAGLRPLVRCKMGLRAEVKVPDGSAGAPGSGGATFAYELQKKLAWDVVSRALSTYR